MISKDNSELQNKYSVKWNGFSCLKMWSVGEIFVNTEMTLRVS
jgi:hypothetical protein